MSFDLGKTRGLQQVTSSDGFFHMCALDHLSDFAELLAPDPSEVSFTDVVRAKDAVVRAVAPSVSALLLDAQYGLGHLVATGALPNQVGMMASIENEDYAIPPGGRKTRFRAGWSVRQMKHVGTDVCKLLWFYRPESSTADHQCDVLRSLVRECFEQGIALVVEPIWYPLADEDPDSKEWKNARIEGIITSAEHANTIGPDMLKVEFPGCVNSAAERQRAAKACAELDARVNVPWVILSAGVGYEDFRAQVRLACQAGASGYLAGRSIWRDAVSTRDPRQREIEIQQAQKRLDELNDITRNHGRPYRPEVDVDTAVRLLPENWYLHQ